MLGVHFEEKENDEMRQSHTRVSPCSHGYTSKPKLKKSNHAVMYEMLNSEAKVGKENAHGVCV